MPPESTDRSASEAVVIARSTRNSGARLFVIAILTMYAISYLERFVFLSYYINRNLPIEGYPDWDFVLQPSLISALGISSVLFLGFLVTAWPFTQTPTIRRVDYEPPSAFLIFVIASAVILSLIVRFLFGAKLGEEAVSLPLGLSTIVYRSQSDLFPGVFLLLMEVYWIRQRRRQYTSALIGLALFNVLLSVITTSKAGMIYFLVQLLMIMYLTDQKIFNKPVRIFVLALAGLLVFIVSSELRQQALTGTDSSLFIALSEGRLVETVLQVSGLVLNRLPGVEGLALSCGTNCSGFDTFHVPALNGAAGAIYTQQIVGVASDFDFRSPGIVGGAFLIGGWIGGSALVLAFLFLSLSLLKIADRQTFSASFKALVVFGLFRFALEGTWALVDILALTGGAIIVEALARMLRARSAHGATAHA